MFLYVHHLKGLALSIVWHLILRIFIKGPACNLIYPFSQQTCDLRSADILRGIFLLSFRHLFVYFLK